MSIIVTTGYGQLNRFELPIGTESSFSLKLGPSQGSVILNLPTKASSLHFWTLNEILDQIAAATFDERPLVCSPTAGSRDEPPPPYVAAAISDTQLAAPRISEMDPVNHYVGYYVVLVQAGTDCVYSIKCCCSANGYQRRVPMHGRHSGGADEFVLWVHKVGQWLPWRLRSRLEVFDASIIASVAVDNHHIILGERPPAFRGTQMRNASVSSVFYFVQLNKRGKKNRYCCPSALFAPQKNAELEAVPNQRSVICPLSSLPSSLASLFSVQPSSQITMEESVITISIRTGFSRKKLSLTLSSAYDVNLEPGPGPTMTTLLLDFDDGSIAVSGDAIDFQIVPVVPPQAPLSPPTSSTTITQPSSPLSPLNSSLNRLSLGTGHSSVASISSRDIDRNQLFVVSVKIPKQETVVVNVSLSDSVFVLRTKIKAINLTCPPVLIYKGVTLDQNGASLGFHKICPGAEIVGRLSLQISCGK